MIRFSDKLNLIPEYVPGKSIENISEKWGIPPKKIVKLASNENPLGPPQPVVEFLKENAGKVNLYPDRIGINLLKKLSEVFTVQRENIFIGNGSSEIVDMLCRVILNQKDNGIIFEKEFALYKTCIRASGGIPKEAKLEKNFERNPNKLLTLIDSNTKIIFLANPNNPTGNIINKEEVIKFIEKVPENILIIIDEAYIEYTGEEFSVLEYFKKTNRENLVILRTFSKIYGLAGLRVGYCFAHQNIIQALRQIKLPVNVPFLSQKGCEIALSCSDFKEKSKKLVEEEKKRIFSHLKEKGIEYMDCQGNFYLVKDENSEKTIETLESKGIIVRSLKPYEINDFFRVTVGTKEQNDIFLKELLKIRKNQIK